MSDGAGDDEDSGANRGTDAEKDEVEQAEAANESVAGDCSDGGLGVRR